MWKLTGPCLGRGRDRSWAPGHDRSSAFVLAPRLQGHVAQALAFFFSLDPQVDVPLHITQEHLPTVTLRPHQQIAKVLNCVLAVCDRHVFARPRYISYINIEPPPGFRGRCQRVDAIDRPPLRPIRRRRIAVVDRAMLV